MIVHTHCLMKLFNDINVLKAIFFYKNPILTCSLVPTSELCLVFDCGLIDWGILLMAVGVRAKCCFVFVWISSKYSLVHFLKLGSIMIVFV